MKTSFIALAAVLMTLCFSSTAFANAPAPTFGDAPMISTSNILQFYYSAKSSPMYCSKIIREAEAVPVKEGQDTAIYMEFDGYPLPTVYLYRNGKEIDFRLQTLTKRSKYSLSCKDGHCVLRIFEAEGTDTGTYTFRVVNLLGEAQTSADLEVIMSKN